MNVPKIRPPKKSAYVEDQLMAPLFLNPFKDLSKPFLQHLDVSEDIVEKALGDEIQATKLRKDHYNKHLSFINQERK